MKKYYTVFWGGAYKEATSIEEAKEFAKTYGDEYIMPALYIAVVDVDDLPDGINPEDVIYACDIEKIDIT